MEPQKIQAIRQDWQDGLSPVAIMNKHSISREQEYAITECTDGLTVAQVAARIGFVRASMTSTEIKSTMAASFALGSELQ